MNNLIHHIENIREILTYIFYYAPNFPDRDKTNLKQNFDDLWFHLDELIGQAQESEPKRWLRICREETKTAFDEYSSGRISSGKSTIKSAREHFNNYLHGKKTAAVFVVGPDGVATGGKEDKK